MALQDEILSEILAGRLSEQWTSSDLLANQALAQTHPDTTLRTLPANHSSTLPGLGLGQGQRVRALLFALPIHCPSIPKTVPPVVTPKARQEEMKIQSKEEADNVSC